MNETKWTDNQKKAIDARGMQILVSAAAGSGKTAVLTERVKNILTDTNNPCKMSEILVVTFTRAAAGEMKDRIYKALKKAKKDSVNSDFIAEQISSVPLADICTIDAFSSKIVKDNFSKAGVSLDYTVLDDKELNELKEKALKTVIDELYEENSSAFIKLTTMFLSERDDKALGEIILNLHKDSRSYPSPEKWLESIADSFSPQKEPNETIWADVIYKHLYLFADYHQKRLSLAVNMIVDSGGFTPVFVEKFNYSIDKLDTLKRLVDARNWDGCVQLLREGLYMALRTTNRNVDPYVKELVSDLYDSFKKEADSFYESFTMPTTKEHQADCVILKPVVEVLCRAVTRLEEELSAMKVERNAYSFDDILHKCINLLVDFNGDNWTPTPIAVSLREKYKEIFIDEYQDTNQAQNIIFEAISRNCENLYCVGDVKQSIYKFRLASPKLFMSLRKNLPEYDGKKHPSQITLDRNFRSRKGVTDAVNFTFSTLMSEAVGEIDYNEREALVCGADYTAKPTPDIELLCLDYSDKNSQEAVKCEAEQIAHYIKRLLNKGITVKDKNGERPLESSDICILLRVMKNKARIFSDSLNELNIPSNAVLDGDVSLNKEVQLLISLIKVINNPLMDIELVSVLFSPVFGFSADELSEIRMIDRNAELYSCLEAYSETSLKAARFLSKLRLYRNISASYPINEFVRFVVADTDIENIFLACDNGFSRKANIRGFLTFADSFTESGGSGLGAFCRSIDVAVETKKLTSYPGAIAPEGLQIMSVHKSKGLEFPYVILADCSSEFNKSDAWKPLKISRETGIGLKIRDDENFTTYNTVSSLATEKDILYSSASEELRILYVAMTRAREHLTFACSFKNRDGLKKSIRLNNYFGYSSNGKLHPYAVYKANSMSSWILNCFSQHQNGEIVCQLCDINIPYKSNDSFYADVSPAVEYESENNLLNDEIIAEADDDIVAKITERTSYKYKFDCSGLLAKRTASSTEKTVLSREYFANKKPRFASKALTGASRGTAIHKFFELCDFQNAFNDPDEEKNRLFKENKMSEEEISVIDFASVNAFFASSVGERLLKADNVFKEYEFSFIKKAGELYSGIASEIFDEDIVVQGKLDCAFSEKGEAVLIDYKSDSITDEQLYKEIYTPQLNIYAEALERCTGLPVKEKYIYSFKLQKFINIL